MQKNNLVVYLVMTALAVLAVSGWSLALNKGGEAIAHTSTAVDGPTLDLLYEAVFHRRVDSAGASFHTGRELSVVLNDFINSGEMKYYGAVFKAIKAYEEAQRVDGELFPQEIDSYLKLINSSLGVLSAWVSTSSNQQACNASVNATQAGDAIQSAYDVLAPSVKTSAEYGLFNSSQYIGQPKTIPVYWKCLGIPSSTPSLGQ